MPAARAVAAMVAQLSVNSRSCGSWPVGRSDRLSIEHAKPIGSIVALPPSITMSGLNGQPGCQVTEVAV